MLDPGLRGKVAIVTGAQHGIGAATARALAAQGVAVFITYLRVPTPPGGPAVYEVGRSSDADRVLRAIRERGGHADALETDLSDPAHIPLLFDRAEATFGPVEILVNNAAYWHGGDTLAPRVAESGPAASVAGSYPVFPMTAESHDASFAVNSRAVALTMREFAQRHARRGATWGRIINVSTDAARCFPGEVSYAASKAALESYSRSAARELGRFGITVNIVAPGPIQTGYMAPEMVDRESARTPLGRVGQPEDVADVIVFLCSTQARWLTGQLLFVGGGHKM